MPFDHVILFGEQGNGGPYIFPVTPEGIRGAVYLWDILDDRTYETTSMVHWLWCAP